MADPVVADYYLGAVPASPTALKGVQAPKMLAFLPTYYAASTHVRQMLQVEGYETDFIRYMAETVIPTLTRPADCPEWALAMWEAVLRLPGRSTWTAAQRRAAITARIGQVISSAEIKAFLAAEALCLSSAITLAAHATANQVDVTTAGLTAGQNDAIKAASLIAFAAHLKISVNAVVIR